MGKLRTEFLLHLTVTDHEDRPLDLFKEGDSEGRSLLYTHLLLAKLGEDLADQAVDFDDEEVL